jgi:molecular chaperone DnaJ
MKNYYEILGVDENATQDDIKKAYRKLSKQYHPDVNDEGEEMFKEISEAYENIGDETKRQEYENRRKNPFGNMGGMGFDFNSIFEHMMGRSKPKAPDKVMSIDITPEESYFGVKKEFKLFNNVVCVPCDGSGGTKKICNTCQGQGVVIQTFGTGMFRQRVQTTCPSCNGHGNQILNLCKSCNGQGVTKKEDHLQVSIPTNVDNGDFLRLQQKGDYHPQIKMFGDLILKVNLVSDDKFQKMGMDLIYNKKIDPLTLLIEDQLIIEHPDGDLSIKIPETLNTEKPLRIFNKGYKTPAGNGNFYIKIIVEKDSNLDPEIKEKIKESLKKIVD